MTKQRILIADDEPQIREVVRILLEGEGFEVIEAADGMQAVAKADDTIDLFILDVMMPGMDGVAACMRIREVSRAPILFLTAKSQDQDKTLGFSAGCDDYLSKPFSYAELTARVKAMLRRYTVYRGKPAGSAGSIDLGGLTIDPHASKVIKNGEEVALTDLEYRILCLLAQNRGKIFTAQNIYESVWQEPYFYNSNNTVMVHIRNLRKKIEDDPRDPVYLKNVWGRGYRIE